jgi:hypothetical protein
VKALNRLVDVLGSEVDADRIISKVVREYHVNSSRAEAAAEGAEESKRRVIRDKIYVLRERLQSQPYVDLAKELASLLGFEIKETEGSFFKNGEYIVCKHETVVARFSEGPDFVMWVKKNLASDISED